MKFSMKRIVWASMSVLLALVAWPSYSQSTPWPNHSIRLVIPFAPGGGTDILARIIAPKLSEKLGQQIVVDNKPGASSIIGSQMVVQAPPDGYTVMMVDSSILMNPGLRSDLPYDTLKDFTPIAHMAIGPVILVVNPSIPAKTLSELIALAKAKPDELFFGSGGNGASTHLAGELFNMAAGVKISHVPYKGTGEALAAVVAGQVPITFTGISSARQPIDANRLRGLALTGDKRNPALPEVPTFIEAGLAGVDSGTHWGMLGPAGMPAEIVVTLNKAVNEVLQDPEVNSRVVALGYEVAGGPAENYANLIKTDVDKWSRVIKASGIRAD